MPDRKMAAFPTHSVHVSCAPHTLYGNAVPADIANDVHPRAYGIEVIDRLFAGTRYDWRFPADGFVVPDDFTDQLARFYDGMAAKRCPPSVLVRIKGATLFKTTIHCSGPAGSAVLYETYRAGERTPDAMPSIDQWNDVDRTKFAGERWQNLFVGSIGTPNYGHWLIDDLPRLKAAMHLRTGDRRPVRILIHQFHDRIDRIRIESIRLLLGDEVRIEFLDFNRAYHFDELHYATPVSDHPVQKSPLALSFIARKICERAIIDVTRDGGGDRLFVTRSASRGRLLSNQAVVADLVKAHGFRTIDTETMGFSEQVQVFAAASIVIGQMGAAMTNTMFCPPTATILYLAPWGWIEPFYWDLAAVRGHRYRVLYGAVTAHGIPAHERAFDIDPTALSQALALM